MGSSDVGKTTLMAKYTTKDDSKTKLETRATIGCDLAKRFIEFEGQSVCVEIWDTAG